MNSGIKRYLESKGFETRSFDKDMSVFVKTDKSTIVEIVFFSESDFNVNIKSNVTGSDLSFGKKVRTKQSESVNRPIEGQDIVSAFYSCLNEFEHSLIMHVENLKSIQTILQQLFCTYC